jgi:hypothetical protein
VLETAASAAGSHDTLCRLRCSGAGTDSAEEGVGDARCFWLRKMRTGERAGKIPSEDVSTCIVGGEARDFGAGERR